MDQAAGQGTQRSNKERHPQEFESLQLDTHTHLHHHNSQVDLSNTGTVKGTERH